MSAITDAGRWRRLGWFVALWLAGVLTVAAIAYGLRAILGLG